MLLQVIQEVAQSIVDEGLGLGGMIWLFGSMSMVVVLILDRLISMLQSRGIIPKKPGNPNGVEKLKELHEWYTPKNVGEKPPCMSWLPMDEFIEQQEKQTKLLEQILSKVSNEVQE